MPQKFNQKLLVARTLGTKKLLLLPFALLWVGALWLLSRFIRVNIHQVVNSRIGHPNTLHLAPSNFSDNTSFCTNYTFDVNLKSLVPQKFEQKLLVARILGIKKLLLLPFALLWVGALWLLSRFIRVNIHQVVNSRIGHFATNTELSVLKARGLAQGSKHRGFDIFLATSEKSCNAALETLWKCKINFKTGKWGWLLNDISKRLKSVNFLQKSTALDTKGRLIDFPPSLSFDKIEMAVGDEFLTRLNIANREKFVCLNVRDNSFLAKSDNLGWSKSRDWTYHNYRDSEISTYVAAAEALAEMGYTVFRMGAIVEKPLISKHSLVIDYATNEMRTEFLDIFLGAHCTFCVSTGSGWDSIPQIFRRPTLYVNLLPHFPVDCVVRDLLIYPKNLVDADTKALLNLNEILERNIQTIHSSHGYEDARVEIRNLNSNQLVQAVAEMAQRVEGTHVETSEQKEMQAKLKHTLSTNPKLQPTPNYYPIRAEFASCFLSNNPNFLD